MSNPPSGDRPLSGMANAMLLAGATGAMLLFYLFALTSILILLVILGVEFVVFIALARFGLLRLMVPTMQRHGTVLGIFLRSMWLGKSTEFQIPIKAEDAPALRTMLKRVCDRAQVPLPRKVFLQMKVNAWVQMKGYRAGAGETILGLGYDLLAGLSQVEIEGVLAHEMMHAKLVQRGFRQLLTGGIMRAARLTNGLAAQLAAGRRVKKSNLLLETCMSGADNLTRLAARQLAACSRQDEFAADRGAAELCGAGAIRSSLLKLEGLNRIASRLPLRERIAQLESGGGFGQWLMTELAAAGPPSQIEARAQVFNKYSTHPSLHDRLAALATFPDQTLADSPSALELLAHPDVVGEKLVAAIQKQIIGQEQKDSKQLDRWNRRTTNSRQLQPMQVLGLVVCIVGFVIGLIVAAAQGSSVMAGVVVALTSIAAGIAMIRYCGYQEKMALPVPDFPLIKASSQKKLDVKPEQVQAIEGELRNLMVEPKRKERLARLLEQSYRALGECDYVRAHVAARFCLEVDKKSIPGTLALAVAAGALKQGQQVGRAVHFVRRWTGLKGESTAWGAGWALALVSDWVHAEVFLEQARNKKTGAATVLALLAICQSRRGKLFTAIESARQAYALRPQDKEYAKLLIDLLLQGGFLREVRELLQALVNEAVTDSELMVEMVKLSLLQRDESTAEAWIDLIRQSPDGPKKFVTLGEVCVAARRDEKAAEHFQVALTNGHYPEALLGLGRLEATRNPQQAGEYLLAALDLHRPLGENSVGPVPLVVPILQQLKLLQEPILNCRAWIAALPRDAQPPALAGVSFLIYAPTSDDAQKSLSTVLRAMQPDAPPLPTIRWSKAPKEQQPDGPVHPGIQAVLN